MKLTLPATVTAPVTVEGATSRGQDPAGQFREIVVLPLGDLRVGVHLVEVTIGAYEVDVLATITAPVTVEGATSRGQDPTGQLREIVVLPLGDLRVGVHLVEVTIGANEVDVLATVTAPVTVEGATSRKAVIPPANFVEIVVLPLGDLRVGVHLMEVTIGAHEVDVLATVTAPVTVEGATSRGQDPAGQLREIVVDPTEAKILNQTTDVLARANTEVRNIGHINVIRRPLFPWSEPLVPCYAGGASFAIDGLLNARLENVD